MLSNANDYAGSKRKVSKLSKRGIAIPKLHRISFLWNNSVPFLDVHLLSWIKMFDEGFMIVSSIISRTLFNENNKIHCKLSKQLIRNLSDIVYVTLEMVLLYLESWNLLFCVCLSLIYVVEMYLNSKILFWTSFSSYTMYIHILFYEFRTRCWYFILM